MFVSLSYAETNCTSQGAEDEGYNSFSLTTTTTTTNNNNNDKKKNENENKIQ